MLAQLIALDVFDSAPPTPTPTPSPFPLAEGGVAFDYALWALEYPELASSINSATANRYFFLAGTMFANSYLSPVCDHALRLTYLNMIVAHLATIYSPINGQAPSGIVGRITEAREGDVSVKAADIAGKSATAAFWTQTPYGLMFWTATAYLRQGFYMPGSQPNFEPFYGLPQRYPYG